MNNKRMEDRDFVARFIGFYDGYDDYDSDLDTHLNGKMNNLSTLTEQQIDKLKNDFIKAMKAAFDIFGDDAFRKRFKLDDARYPLNKAIFEAVSVNLAKMSEADIQKLVEKREGIKQGLIDLFNNNGVFLNSISSATGDVLKIKLRMDTIKELFQEGLRDD